MARNETRFGGELGSILTSALHPSVMFFGALSGGLVIGVAALLLAIGMDRLVPFFAQGLVSLMVIRTARSTSHTGELDSPWRAPGTTWPDDIATLGRVIVLNLAWVIPLSILQPQLSSAGFGPGMGIAAAILVPAVALLPPMFLISAVGADRMMDLIDPDHWRSTFAGRGGELMVLFSSYLGGVMLTGGFGLLLATSLGSGKAQLTIFLFLVAGSYGFGFMVLLLGRLVGMFLGGSGSADLEFLPETDPTPEAKRPRRRQGGIEVDDDVDVDGLFEGAGDDGAFDVPDAPASAEARPVSAAGPAPGVVPLVAAAPANATSVSEMLRAVQRTAETDLQRALDELEQWATAHRAPHPMVSARRACLHLKLGRDDAFGIATSAVDQARAGSAVGALNELYDAFGAQAGALGLTAEDWQKMAAAKTSLGKDAEAVELYGKVLAERPDAMPSIKGLIQIADNYLKLEDGADQALVIYNLLDRRCPDHPFGDFVDRGRDQAQRKLQKTR